ncbi:MAG: hypothetical protein NC131_10255 [Roseburia sp.]|nr:hypothetical protein [Roseburia sp.]
MALVYSAEAYIGGPEVKMYDEIEPKQIKKPKVIPMPFIKDAKGSKDKIIVTEEWYVKTKKKKLAKQAKERRDIQIEMMELLGERDILRSKLSELDDSKKKDMKKIVSINVKIKDINAELEMLQKEAGINVDDLDKGTKLGRFYNKLKRNIKKKVKKAKKWIKRNRELVSGVLSVIVPILIGFVAKKLLFLVV